FMTLLAAFAVLLGRISGQDDVLVGTSAANRATPELEGVVGLFVNTLVIRADMGGDPTFRALMRRVRERCLGAYLHQDVPFDRLADELDRDREPGRNPLFQAMFVLQNLPGGKLELPGVSVRAWEPPVPAAKFDLLLGMAETEAGLVGTLEYAADVFEPATAVRMMEHFQELLESATAEPGLPVSELSMGGGSAAGALDAFNADLEL
ncbi:MAG TPA: condensation domain-containing protein, partial [Longimicrobium sp.]|nr:condensation domain-containing protein [Longimicrobium sp.]